MNYNVSNDELALMEGMTMDEAAKLFAEGLNDYMAGGVPEGWNNPTLRFHPYILGWNMGGDLENGGHDWDAMDALISGDEDA